MQNFYCKMDEWIYSYFDCLRLRHFIPPKSSVLMKLFYKSLDLLTFEFCISEEDVREKMCIWKKYDMYLKEIWEVYFKSNTFSLRLQDSVYKILLLVPSENRRIWISYLSLNHLGQKLCFDHVEAFGMIRI